MGTRLSSVFDALSHLARTISQSHADCTCTCYRTPSAIRKAPTRSRTDYFSTICIL